MATKFKIFLMVLLLPLFGKAQISTGQDMQQLLLDIEKLTQFKAILSDMEQGYAILTQGYGQVKNLAQGNFNLHSVFLNGLLQVNPEVAHYARVADIIAVEATLLTEYKRANSRLRSGGVFNAAELAYCAQVYSQLTSEALDDLNQLADILLAGKLRMSDDERLSAIDRLYASGQDRLSFLRHFNTQASLMQLQRLRELNETQTLKNIQP
jgi:hypothetical protein